jgi:hypothetical protein
VASSSESKFQPITPPLEGEKPRHKAGQTLILAALTSKTGKTLVAYMMIVDGLMTRLSSTFTSEKRTPPHAQ